MSTMSAVADVRTSAPTTAGAIECMPARIATVGYADGTAFGTCPRPAVALMVHRCIGARWQDDDGNRIPYPARVLDRYEQTWPVCREHMTDDPNTLRLLARTGEATIASGAIDIFMIATTRRNS